jgi:cytochrome P450
MSELDPQQHIRKQRNIASGYALSNIIKHEPHFDTILRLLTTRLDSFCRLGQPVELDRWFTFFAFDAVGEAIFSKSFGFLEQGKDVRDAIANQRLLAPYAAVMGYYAWFHNLTFGNPLLSRLGIQPSSHIFDTCVAAIDARKENPAKRNDMMQKWLDTRAKYPDRMEEIEVFSTAVGTLGAGGDTVSATIQALFYFLIRHPQYMARLQEELDAAQAREELSPIVQYSEAQKLPFLQACVLFLPPAPLAHMILIPSNR